jgi:hypothetical protein
MHFQNNLFQYGCQFMYRLGVSLEVSSFLDALPRGTFLTVNPYPQFMEMTIELPRFLDSLPDFAPDLRLAVLGAKAAVTCFRIPPPPPSRHRWGIFRSPSWWAGGFLFCAMPFFYSVAWPFQNGSLRHSKYCHLQGSLNHFEAAQ